MSIFQRNDPCPCGSGKKYEHCCCLESGPDRGRWERVLAARSGNPVELEAAAEAFVAGTRGLDGRRLLAVATALVEPLRRAGRTQVLERMFQEFETRYPLAYEASALWFAVRRAENSVLLPEGDRESPRAALAALVPRLPGSLADFLVLAETLLYHGRTAGLLDVVTEAMSAIDDPGDGRRDRQPLEEIFLLVGLARVVGNRAALSAAYVDSLARTLGPHAEALSNLQATVAHVHGAPQRHWRQVDFLETEDLEARVLSLTGDFARFLHEKKGWPVARALLARSEIGHWLLVSQGLQPGSSAVAVPFVFVHPDTAVLVARLLLSASPSRLHRAGAFSLALLPWLEFCDRQGLVPRKMTPALWREMVERFQPFAPLLDDLEPHDPVLQHDVRLCWEKPWKRPARARPRRATQLGLFAPSA